MKAFFPVDRLGRADYIIGLSFLATCFVLFFHRDITGAGSELIKLPFGRPLDFYENCKKIRGGGQHMLGTPYPPSIYVIFALWLYPFKVFGLITGPETFPYYLTFWLKVLTTLVYLASAKIFYQILLEYWPNNKWAEYSAVAWLTMPLALFSQFIFSQYDIFYVILTLAGFLMFLRSGLYRASLLFGIAITFKYFPVFVFVPLLLLYEKRLWRIISYFAIFVAPTLFIYLLYGWSPAFIEGVTHHRSIGRVFAASLDLGGWRVSLLFASFTILCGLAYFMEVANNARTRAAAYFWLTSSILPFLFLIWHPQWVMFFAPAIVLTTMIDYRHEKFMILDLVGMFFFVGTISLAYQNKVDAVMFRGSMLGFDFENSFLMARLFDRFHDNSLEVFFSGFWGYLLLQVVLKYNLCFYETIDAATYRSNYAHIRQRLYVGLLIFLVPASIAIYKDLKRSENFINNDVSGRHVRSAFEYEKVRADFRGQR